MNFRRVVTALAVLALFAGLACAHVTNPNPVSCTVSAASNPTIRSEGVAERVGDILITCTGGNVPNTTGAAAAPFANGADRVNITVNYGTTVTSPNADPMSPMLFIDEPGSMNQSTLTSVLGLTPAPGTSAWGPAATIGAGNANGICTAANQGTAFSQASPAAGGVFDQTKQCAAFAGSLTFNGTNFIVGMTSSIFAANSNMQNVYQGTVGASSGSSFNNQVTFSNVPFIATGLSNVSRVFRIHNVRVQPGSAATITATVSTSAVTGSAQTMSITSGNGATVATPATSLTASLTQTTAGASLCAPNALNPGTGQSRANVTLLTFKAGFGNAFKTRNLPLSVAAAPATSWAVSSVAGDAETPAAFTNFTTATSSLPAASFMQGASVAGTIKVGSTTFNTLNSETGIIFTDGAGTTYGVGAAASTTGPSTGTRFKISFAGLPANVTYYVSVNNVTDFQTQPGTVPTNVGDDTVTPYAQLVSSETGAYAATASTANANGTAPAGIPVVALTVPTSGSSAGKVSIIYEVTNVSPSSAPTLNFAVYAVYNLATAPSPSNAATVTMGYADSNGSTTTSPVGVTVIGIPRFASNTAVTNTASTFFNIVACQTALLMPYITNGAGYETGISVSNTSLDPFGTIQSTGTCNMYFYGSNQPAGPITLTSPTGSTSIPAGGNIANTASGLGLINFTGYGVAVCNFQFAHGFVFVQTSKQTLGMGYLALVMQTGTGLNTRGQALVGETLSQ